MGYSKIGWSPTGYRQYTFSKQWRWNHVNGLVTLEMAMGQTGPRPSVFDAEPLSHLCIFLGEPQATHLFAHKLAVSLWAISTF